MKSILFLGGGFLGLNSIKWAKEIGFNVIINDKSQNAPGFEFADKIINYDSTNIRSLTSWVIKNNDEWNIKYCYCSSDFGLLTAASIHSVLKVTFPNFRNILNGLDKELMKKSWSEKNINFPKSLTLYNEKDIKPFIDQLEFPLVVKPSSSSGSRGVSIVSCLKNINKAIGEAFQFSDNSVIIEEYIHGSHHDVNGLFWDGKFFRCGIGDRFFTDIPYPVPKHGYFPTSLNNNLTNKIYTQLESGSKAMGLNHGPVKGDCVIKDGKVYFYEISPRFHGDVFTANTLAFLNEKNPIYQLFKMIFDSNYTFQNISSINIFAGWKTIFRNKIEIAQNKNIKLYFREGIENSRKSKIKNNDEIFGLAWTSAKSKKVGKERLNLE